MNDITPDGVSLSWVEETLTADGIDMTRLRLSPAVLVQSDDDSGALEDAAHALLTRGANSRWGEPGVFVVTGRRR